MLNPTDDNTNLYIGGIAIGKVVKPRVLTLVDLTLCVREMSLEDMPSV